MPWIWGRGAPGSQEKDVSPGRRLMSEAERPSAKHSENQLLDSGTQGHWGQVVSGLGVKEKVGPG